MRARFLGDREAVGDEQEVELAALGGRALVMGLFLG
jgi:hypothetical protein